MIVLTIRQNLLNLNYFYLKLKERLVIMMSLSLYMIEVGKLPNQNAN